MRWATPVAASALAALLLAGCGGGGGDGDDTAGGGSGSSGHEHADEADGPAGGDPEPPAPFSDAEATTRVQVVLQDYAFVGIGDTVAGPNVVFAASIRGGNTHELEVVDAAGAKVGAIPPFKAPASRSRAMVLAPGTYTVQCLIREGPRTHAQMGMKKLLTVT